MGKKFRGNFRGEIFIDEAFIEITIVEMNQTLTIEKKVFNNKIIKKLKRQLLSCDEPKSHNQTSATRNYTNVNFRKNFKEHTGMIIGDEDLENSTDLSLSSFVVTVGKDNIVSILAINLIDHANTFTKNKQITVFRFLSPQVKEDNIELLAIHSMKDGEVLRENIQLMRWEEKEEEDKLNILFLHMMKFGFPHHKIVKILITYIPYRARFLIT